MSRSEFTLRIVYRVPGGPRHTRRIPWNWQPSTGDVIDAVRRLRKQYQNVEVVSATLTREVLVERYNIPQPGEVT